MVFRLLDLPSELRNAIYAQVLNPDSFRQHSDDVDTRYSFDFTLFYINRQIYYESRQVFFQNFIFVRVETPWEEAHQHVETDGHVPILCKGHQADAFTHHCLSVAIAAPGEEISEPKPRIFLLLLDDLSAFCRIWFYSDLNYAGELNKHLGLTLKPHNPHSENPEEQLPIALQKRLLTPFGAVKNLLSVKIDGPHDERIYTSLKEEINTPPKSAEKCLEQAVLHKEMGNQALSKGSPQMAIDLYLQSFKAMHILCIGRHRSVWGDVWFDKILTGGVFDGQHGLIVRIGLRVRLVANIVKAYLDMHDPVEAEFWGRRTIDHVRRATGTDDTQAPLNIPWAKPLGKIYYRTGLACKMLGKIYEARRLLRIAYDYLPDEEPVRRELASVSLCLG